MSMAWGILMILLGILVIVIEIPFGETAKVRSHEEALKLQYYFKAVGSAIGLKLYGPLSSG